MVLMFPGYKHVQAFGPDDEYEDEVEVSYVTLDLGGNVNKTLLPNTTEYRLIGLDTPTPMLQLSGTFFRGVHEQLVGTELLFTDGRDETNLSRKFVVPVATTEKRVKFDPVEVTEKKAEDEKERSNHMTRNSSGPRGKVSRRGGGRGSGKGKEKGKGKGKGKGPPTGELMQQGEMVMDLDPPLSSVI